MNELSIKEYIDSLKSSNPTPGGGSANCLLAKTAVSLALMSINVSKNRKSFQSVSFEKREYIEITINKLEEYINKLEEFSSEDERVFNEFMKVYREKDEEKMEKASIECYLVPFNMLIETEKVVEEIIGLKDYIVSSITSDFKMSLCTLKAVLENCKFNLDINIVNINHPDYKKSDKLIHRSCDEKIEKITKILKEMK